MELTFLPSGLLVNRDLSLFMSAQTKPFKSKNSCHINNFLNAGEGRLSLQKQALSRAPQLIFTVISGERESQRAKTLRNRKVSEDYAISILHN